MAKSAAMAAFLIDFLLLSFNCHGLNPEPNLNRRRPKKEEEGLCKQLIQPSGYPCSEHIVQTEDGFLLGLQRVSSRNPDIKLDPSTPPILLQHGLFQAGDVWFLNSVEQSLGFILADYGFDVWVANVRGTRWSHGHISLTEKDKKFWDWTWQELALHDLAQMINYVYSETGSKVYYVGHSQGTIMALAAFTRPYIVDMVEAAALLCPISYLGHISSQFVLKMVGIHLDQMILVMGIHQLNFRSDFGVYILDYICDERMDCNDLLTSITGKNCGFNNSRVDFYLRYEPHPTSTKNLNHLFQLIRKGNFAMYDHGLLGNLKQYSQVQPPQFDIGSIPKSLPLWMGYGGNDALADVTDMEHTLKDLKSKPKLLYLESYGHIDFILGVKAREDVYENMIQFFRTRAKRLSS